MIKNAPPGMAGVLRYQQYIFFPILCFARMMWAQQSLAHARLLARVSSRGAAELALLSVHYLLFAAAPLLVLSPLKAAVFFVLAQVWHHPLQAAVSSPSSALAAAAVH